jgi:hypothetical protein
MYTSPISPYLSKCLLRSCWSERRLRFPIFRVVIVEVLGGGPLPEKRLLARPLDELRSLALRPRLRSRLRLRRPLLLDRRAGLRLRRPGFLPPEISTLNDLPSSSFPLSLLHASAASRSSSNSTKPKPGGWRAIQTDVIVPISLKKSSRSALLVSSCKFPT